ncbi:MAG: aspartyl protease family protein [Dehalococcoidia bacterium]
MLEGRFGDTTGSPYIEGQVSLPRLGVVSNVSFLVDTGASRSVLGAVDVRAMGVDISDLRGSVPVDGIGGTEYCFEEDAYLLFSDDEKTFYYRIDLLISSRSADDELRLPSILGRHVLHRWKMYYSPTDPQPTLAFEVVSDDLSIPMDS